MHLAQYLFLRASDYLLYIHMDNILLFTGGIVL